MCAFRSRYIVGLTGGIACGKSHVLETLAGEGMPALCADKISHDLTAAGGAALPDIRRAFGDAVFAGESLDRKALGAVVFADESARRTLEAILHPMVLRELEEKTCAILSAAPLSPEDSRKPRPYPILWDVPLLYEAGIDRFCNEVWCAYVPRLEQVRRVMKRDGLLSAEAELRVDSQLSTGEKARMADYVIDTSGTREQTDTLVRALYADLKRRLALA